MSVSRDEVEAQPDTSPGGVGFASAAASGSAWTTAQTVVNKLVTVVAMWAMTRLLEPAEFGLANLAVSIGPFFFILAPFVMGDVLLAEPKRFDERSGAARRIAWMTAWALFVLVVAAALPLERLSDKPGLAFLVVIAALRPLADSVLVISNSRMRLDLSYRRIAQIDGGVNLGATVAGVAMAYSGAGPMSITLPPIAALAVRGWIYWRVCGARIERTVRSGTMRPVASRFAIAGLGQYVNNMLLSLEFVILGFVASESEIGFFSLAFQLAIQANTVIATQLGGVLQPIFAHIRDDVDRQSAAFIRASKLLSAVAVPISLAQATLAVPLFAVLFEPKWTGSVAPLVALSFGQAFMFVSAPAIALLKAQGRFRTYLAWQLGQLVAALVLCILATQHLSEPMLDVARAIGLPTDPLAGKALAISVASALVWGVSCPVAVYLGGRPASLRKRTVAGLFLQPWLVSLPIMAGLALAWIALRASIAPMWADVIALFVLGPIAVLVAILGCVWSRKDTREDFERVMTRFRRRRAGS